MLLAGQGVSSLDDPIRCRHYYGWHTLGLTNGQEARRQPVAGKGATEISQGGSWPTVSP